MKESEANIINNRIKHDLCMLTTGTSPDKVAEIKLEIISWVLNNPFKPGKRQILEMIIEYLEWLSNGKTMFEETLYYKRKIR